MNQATIYKDLSKYIQRRVDIGKEDLKKILVALLDGIEAELCRGNRVKFGELFTLLPVKEVVRKRYDMNLAKVVVMGGGRAIKLHLHTGFKRRFRAGKEVAGPLRSPPPKAFKPSKDCTAGKALGKAQSEKSS